MAEGDDSGDEPEEIPLGESPSELIAAEEGLKALRKHQDAPEPDAETHY